MLLFPLALLSSINQATEKVEYSASTEQALCLSVRTRAFRPFGCHPFPLEDLLFLLHNSFEVKVSIGYTQAVVIAVAVVVDKGCSPPCSSVVVVDPAISVTGFLRSAFWP
jgi:hypothetical protein